MLGFNYWPITSELPGGGWGCAALNDANWRAVRDAVAADLDHMASLGAGILRLMFWPEVSGFNMQGNNQPAQFAPEYHQQTVNLIDLLGMCAQRQLRVVIAFGNNYFDSGPPNDASRRWWMSYYSDFAVFLNDCRIWIDGYVNTIEQSAYRSTVVYYDYQNEYYVNHPYMGWYVTFLYDWSAIPAGKRGVSVLRVPEDAQDLVYQLAVGGGPQQGHRRLDFVDFHSYPDVGANVDIAAACSQMKAAFPQATVVLGEFGFEARRSEGAQAANVQNLMACATAMGIPYCLNWMLWDSTIDPVPASVPWGYDPHTPRDVLGAVAASTSLIANADFESHANGAPTAWEAAGTTSVVLLALGPGAARAATGLWFARLLVEHLPEHQSQASIWLSSYQAPVVPGKRIYVNAYVRGNLQDIRINIVEYDAHRARLRSAPGPAFTPTGWRFHNYLRRAGSFSVQVGPDTAYVIVNISGTVVGLPGILDVDTVSAYQR